MQEVRLVKEGEERDVDDAYEWGRAAGATLFAQNSAISLEFPLGLQSLFNNREFREAMLIGGVLSDKIISLPVIVPTESSSRAESPGYDEVEDEDLLTSFESQSKKRLLAIQDRRNSQQAEIWSNGVVIALPQASEPKMVHPPKGRNRCLCCRSTKIVSGGDVERRIRLRELLWFSLRLDKYYERPTHPFPFCRKCEKRLEEMEDICESMKKLEERYEKCRKDLSKGVLEQLLTMGEVAKKVGAEDGAMDTDEDEDTIHPGKELLCKVDSVCEKTVGVCARERPKQKIQRRLHNLQKRSPPTSGSASVASDPDNLFQHANKQQLYKCDDCDLKFTSEFSKARHKRTVHDKELPFSCKVCQKSFSRYDLLKVHERVHTGEKPYTCPECGKDFSHGSNLHDHMRCHKNEKPYKCSLCSIAYARIRSFKVHFRKEHPGAEISFVRVNFPT